MKFTVVVIALTFYYSCGSNSAGLTQTTKQNVADTLFIKNQIVINFPTTLLSDTPRLITSSCLIIDDDSTKKVEQPATKHIEMDSSINFLNSPDDTTEVKNVRLIKDTLLSDFYYLTSGYFSCGSLKIDSAKNIVLSFGGSPSIRPSVHSQIIITKLSFSILMPPEFKYKKILFYQHHS